MDFTGATLEMINVERLSGLKKNGHDEFILFLFLFFCGKPAMESRVFSLESPSSFYTLYSPSKKMELAAELDSIAKQVRRRNNIFLEILPFDWNEVPPRTLDLTYMFLLIDSLSL